MTLQARLRKLLRRRKTRRRKRQRKAKRIDLLRKQREALARGLKKVVRRIGKVRARIKKRREKRQPDFNGRPTNVTPGIREVILLANQMGLYVTATTNGTHAPTSWHYHGRAVDVAAPMTAEGINRMKRFQREAAKRWPGALEIFGPDGFYIKNGVRYVGHFPNHGDHVHVAR